MPDAVSDEEKPVVHTVRVGLPGGTVHELELEADAQLAAVVTKVREAENLDESNTRVRIIISGKLCTDLTQLVKNVVPNGGFIHCAISESSQTQNETQRESGLPRNREVRIPLEAFDIDGGVRIVIPNLNSQNAHDRMLQAGFTADDIRMIRGFVRTLRRETRGRREARSGNTVNRVGTQEADSIDRALRSEPHDLTVRRGHAHNFMTSGGEGTNSDFLMGCIFGYLLGIMILVLLLDNHATRRWRLGIIAGVATNCAFGVLRSNLPFRPDFPPP